MPQRCPECNLLGGHLPNCKAVRPGLLINQPSRESQDATVGIPKFKRIATAWSVDTFQQSIGPVIVSRDAFFLVRVAGGALALGGVFGGLAGAALGSMIDAATSPAPAIAETIVTIDLKNLPVEIRNHPDWPAKKHTGSVTIVPKTIMEYLRFPWWGRLTFYAEGAKVSVAAEIYNRFWILRYMRANGWPL